MHESASLPVEGALPIRAFYVNNLYVENRALLDLEDRTNRLSGHLGKKLLLLGA
jgi:hypothetical protein